MKTSSTPIITLVCLLLAIVSRPSQAQQYSWSTFAGTPGLAGSTDTRGLFNQPYQIARDNNGNVYVADYNNHTVRKVTPAGVVSTLAGTAGLTGSVDGTGAAARFYNPTGIAVDGSGNVYVADVAGANIRKITPAGVVTTLAGNASVANGNLDGTGTGARFSLPCALVVDATSTNLYVADGFSAGGNHNIRKVVLATGVVTTLAGPTGSTGVTGTTDGTGTAARFNRPAGLAIDSNGNILVCDSSNFTIRKVTPAGVVTTLCGLGFTAGSVDGTGNAARFTGPIGITIDGTSNTIFVTEWVNNTIRKITPAGTVTTLCGLAGVSGSVDAVGSNARFNTPIGIVADGTSNTLLISEFGNNDIRRVTYDGACSTWVGASGIPGSTDSVPVTFNGPSGVARDSSGNFFVADWFAGVIRKITPGGLVSTFASGLGNNPYGIDTDAAGNVYVAVQSSHVIQKISPTGTVTPLAGSSGNSGNADGTGTAARFNNPFDLKLDSAGNVYVADTSNHTIRKITPGGVVTTLAGLAGQIGSTDGLGSTARFNFPSAVAMDSSGNVYVADRVNSTIRKVTPAGAVTTLAGQVGVPGSTDGTGTAARFNLGESGLIVDATGNVIVSDQVNNTLRKVTPVGVVTTLCGLAGSGGNTDGVGAAARFNYPLKMALDPQGNVYVACYGSQTVRKVTPGGAVSTFLGTANLVGTGNSSGVFNGCAGVVLDSTGNAYVADQNNHTIRMITPAGAAFTFAGQPGVTGTADGTGSAARFNKPYALAIDAARNLYVADTSNHSIRKITTAGVVTTLAGLTGTAGNVNGTGTTARFNRPYGIAIDSSGTFLYVGDYNNNCIRQVQVSNGAVTTFAGSTSGVSGLVNGTSANARFNGPSGIAVDGSGNVFVADRSNNVIRRISGGNVVTWAGSGAQGSQDGTGAAAVFNSPVGVAVDGQGNVFVAGGWEYDIRKISPTQVVTTIGGLGNTGGYVDGVGTASRFGWAAGITIDPAGNLWVADEDNSCIRKGTRYGTKARIVEPAFGAALPAPTTTFRWEPGIGATNYALFIGSTAGAYDLYAGVEGTNLSKTVTLPADMTVYATMYSYIGGVWQGDSYVFTAAPSQKGVLTSPAQGSTLGSATLSLQWSGGQGCSTYAFWIGSAYGAYDLGSGAYTPGTNSASFTVPTDGGPIYVTLWSLVNGVWQRDDRWFITQLGAGNRAARLTAPATIGSTLAAGSTNFTWDTGVGASSYYLWVGSTPDGYDLYAANEGSGTNRSIFIPGDGRKIYVTLHTLISGAYQSNSYQFTAATVATGPGAVFTNATNNGATFSLNWSSASGATNYALWVGSMPGSYDVYSGSEGLSLNKTVSVPTDGRELHFTIWSLIAGTYYPNMIAATAQNTGGTLRARITSHAQFAALPTANTTFNWNTGSGATAYALWVGSSANASDLYSGLEGSGTTRAVTLPTDGRQIHVTLWSSISGAWQGNSYIFFAPYNPPVEAALVSPAAGSTFAGSTATLNWNTGSGVTQYYLFVGSTPGAYDIYIGDQGTGLSRSLTGLPTDARPIHVTLYSLINGAWQSNAYVFRAWQTP